MKGARYLVGALAVVTVVLVAGWLLRNAIIERVSSPTLADYDLTLVDVSLDALATDSVSIGYLELLHDKGTRIAVEDLQLDLGRSDERRSVYSATSVTIAAGGRDDGAVFELARLIEQLLSLTDSLAGREIHVAELVFPPYPTVRDLTWSVTDTTQQLQAGVESIRLSTALRRVDETRYDIAFSLPPEADAGRAADTVRGTLALTDSGISISGDSILELPRWEAVATLARLLPEAVDVESGSGELRFEASIPFDVSESPSADAVLTPLSPWSLSYAVDSGETTDIALSTGDAIAISSTFPDVEWSIRQAAAALRVTNGEWRDVPLSVAELVCRSGPACSMEVGITWPGADMPIGRAARLESLAVLDVSFPPDGVRVEVRPDATLTLTGFESPDSAVAGLDARLVSATTMQYTNDGWRLGAGAIDAAVESFSAGNDIALTASLFLENLEVSERDRSLSASAGFFAPSIQAALTEQTVALPGLRGGLSLRDAVLAFDLRTVGLLRDGTIAGRYELDRGAGEVTIAGTEMSFGDDALSARVTPWPFDFDIGAGSVAADLHATWRPADTGTAVDARSSLAVEALAGFYADSAFTGLSTALELRSRDGRVELEPAAVRVDLVDIGLPLENISADVTLHVAERRIDVENLRMAAFNGVIGADPFSFDTGNDVNTVTLTAERIELAELMAIKEFEAVTVTGSIAAVLPVTIEQDGLSIDGGTLTGDPPGGVIRYRGGGADETANAGIGLVTTALSNFEYETLTSDVTYGKDGKLELQMQIRGRNPDMDGNRPVVLNLGVENNVLQMLKSLQAARAVEEILENRLVD